MEDTLNIFKGLRPGIVIRRELKKRNILQIKQAESAGYKPDLSKLRPVIFWDTDINRIDWDKNKRAVIRRVFQRGNREEQEEIIRFYGNEEISRYLHGLETASLQ